MNYFANFCANNSTNWIKPMRYTNKREAIKSVRETAIGEVFEGSSAHVAVWTDNDETVYSATISRHNGKFCTTRDN